jgi:hypothetical protein
MKSIYEYLKAELSYNSIYDGILAQGIKRGEDVF